MIKSVTAIFVYQNEIYTIKRRPYLASFPGYTSFPGGKVDKDESKSAISTKFLKDHTPSSMHALIRELKEELNFDLKNDIEKNNVLSFAYVGCAKSPIFNPRRYENSFYRIELKNKILFNFNPSEITSSQWTTPSYIMNEYEQAKLLIVPPTLKLINSIHNNSSSVPFELNTSFSDGSIPFVEMVKGVRQFMPLSNTLFPATRTNSFLIGDEDSDMVLIDPSPKDEEELTKFYHTLQPFRVDYIFLTHHHPDHHEFSPAMSRYFKAPIKMSYDTRSRIMARWGSQYFKGVTVIEVSEGNTLTTSLKRPIKIYSLPGHDEGLLGLAPDTLNWFIVSDLIQTVGTVVIGGNEGDMAKYFHSLQRVIDLSPEVIFPSHGTPIGGTHRLEETLSHRKLRERQIIELLQKKKSNQEILHKIYENIPKELHSLAIETILSHIKKIKNENLI